MKSLIWKEARQQLIWLLVALSLATQLWFGMGNVWDQLVRISSGTGFWVLIYPLIYAFALAQLQFGRDGDTRRFGLLVHRQQGASGYFASKVIVGAGALALVVALPMTIWTLAMSWSDPDASLIHWVRVPQTCLMCVPALLVYAMGVLSTQLRRGALARWSVAIFGVFGAFLLAMPLAVFLESIRPWILGWTSVDLVLVIGILWFARSLLLGGRDRDLPLRDRQLVGIAAITALVLLPFASFVFGSAESSALSVIVEEKPAILLDPQTDEFLAALRTEAGWRRQDARAGEPEITKHWGDLFCIGEQHELELVHYSGSLRVEGANEVRHSLQELSQQKWIGESAPGYWQSDDPAVVAVSSESERQALVGKSWAVQFELDDESGGIHVEASRRAERLPPLQVTVARAGGRFSPQAVFLGSLHHAPIVLDRADGTLWQVELQSEGARVVPLELPGGDRVNELEPLFQRKDATLGRLEEQWYASGERSLGYLFVGGQGTYALIDGKIVPFGESVRPKDAVTFAEAEKLARCAVTSSWPDAFTEQIRVESLPDHKALFEFSAAPSTRGARTAATIYSALAFFRAPAGLIQERCGRRVLATGHTRAPFPEERQIFARGGHSLLFAVLMLWGTLQLFLAWRWLARAGVGIPTRVVYMLFILVGGLAALLITRFLLPRGLMATRANEAVSWTGDSPRPLHAASPRS